MRWRVTPRSLVITQAAAAEQAADAVSAVTNGGQALWEKCRPPARNRRSGLDSKTPVHGMWPFSRPVGGWSGLEQNGQLLGVDLGVVAVAVVEQHVSVFGVAGQGPHPGCPFLQLGLGVAVAEPLVDILALSAVRMPVHADHR
jgi:hypothetical protein